jgi:hypothetical protein
VGVRNFLLRISFRTSLRVTQWTSKELSKEETHMETIGTRPHQPHQLWVFWAYH